MKRLNDHLSLRFRVFVMTLMGVFMLCITDAYAGTAYTDGRAYLRAGSPKNAGKVYVSTSSSTPAASTYKACNTVQTSETTSPSASAQVSGEKTKTTYHFWAVANAGYKFTGWYDSNGALQGSGAAHISASVTSGTAGASDTHAYLDMHAAFIKIIQMGFVVPTNGTYDITHAGEAVSNYASITVDGKVVLTAHPADGYKLRGWYTTTNGGVTKNYFAFGSTCEPNFTNNVTIGAEFVPDDGKATFWIKGTNKIFDDLNKANNAASSGKIIVVVSDGVVGAGTYTIKSGVTLLIPYNETYDLMTTPKVVHYTSAGSAPALSAFRRLTLAKGAIINVNGNICIGGQQTAVNGGNPTSQPCGAAGVLDMSHGGTINLKSGSNLYAWGFVKGQDMDQGNNTKASGVGEINAADSSTVWEYYQCGEWRGGTASSTIYNNKGSWKFFPFQSYTIQNVEVPVNYASGSSLQCHWAIFGNGSTFTVKFPLIAASNSLFKLASGGTLRKWYDPTTDRVCYELGGTTSLDALNLNVLGESVSSSDYNLPIPANMHIILKSGNTLTISKPMTAHAGAVVEVKSGATLNINNKVYMYDADDWDTYCMYAYYYRTYKNLTSHYDRGTGTSKANLEDATLIVDGTVNVGAQNLYATAHGASIIGNGGGILKYGTLPSNTTMVQCKTLSDNVSVNIRSANLRNDNGSYTKGIASTTFKNVNGRWFTSAASTEKANHTYDFTYIKSGDVYGTGGTNGTVSACYSKDKTGLELQNKWANIKAEVCTNWWVGIDDSHLYNWTLNNAWHQYIKTGSTVAEEGEEPIVTYAGSDGKVYQKQGCDIVVDGSMENCLYGTKALVNGSFIAVVKNTAPDEGYHKSGAATTYYLCFDGCVWHQATTRDAVNLYTVDGTKYIWYNNAWLAVTYDSKVKLYYSLSATNVRIYYEYIDNAWVLASPVAEVVTSAGTEQVFSLDDAKTKAKAGGANVTIRLLKDMKITSAFTYDGANNCSLDLNGFTLTGTVTNMIKINHASATFIIKDQSGAGTGKIQAKFSHGAVLYGLEVTQGHLMINSGTVHIENTNTNTSYGACGVVVKSGHKFTMNGGTLETVSKGESWGVNTESTTTSTVTVNGGSILASTTSTSVGASGIYSKGGIFTIDGGTLAAKAATLAKGICLTDEKSTLTVNGGTVSVSANDGATNEKARGISIEGNSATNINGGTIIATATAATAFGIYSSGTTTINGGKIRATAKSDAFGAYCYRNQMVINTTDTIHAKATEEVAAGVVTIDATSVLKVNAGTVNVTAPDKAYGLYANHGKDTINGGEFLVSATGSQKPAYGMYLVKTNPKVVVNGGKFKVNASADAYKHINFIASGGAATQMSLAGGYYSKEPDASAELGTGNCIPSGKTVKDLDATVEASLISAGYTKKIAGVEYTVTWKDLNGTTLKTEKVESGKVPVWTGERPDYKDATQESRWIGWSTAAWRGGTAYINGTPLPAIAASNVTYFAYCETIYADVTAGGTTTRYNDIYAAWDAAMAQKQATIRILSNLGSEASPGNCRQLEFKPANANSIITLDLNGHTWSMGSNAEYNQGVFIRVNKADSKLIITDNSASGNGYLMNKWARAGVIHCIVVAAGELILQAGEIRANNTTTSNAECYSVGIQVNGGAKFTMTGGKVYATDANTPRGINTTPSATTVISGGTVHAYATANSSYGILSYGTTTVEDGATIKAESVGSGAYGAHTEGTLIINGGSFTAKAASNARALYARNGGKITVEGGSISAEVTGNEAYCAYPTDANSEIIINGGSFTSTGTTTSSDIMGIRAISSGSATVNGGTFTLNGGYNWTFGAFAESGTINLNGGEFTITQHSDGNAEAVRVYPDGTCNISGGTYTVTNTTNESGANAINAFGGTTNITGNPVFNAYYGVNVPNVIVGTGTYTATVVIDGGTFNAQSWALQSLSKTNGDKSVTGDITVWDGKFKSLKGWDVIGTSSPTANLKIRGGYYNNNASGKLATGSGNYVVSPSTVETLTSGTEYDAGYRYHVATKYKVTWKDGATTLKEENYNRNETPSYGSDYVPSDGNTYTFTGWTPAPAPIQSDQIYTAVYTKWEAEIILPNDSSKRYESFATAWTDAQQIQNCTLRVLSNIYYGTSLTYNPAPPAGTTAEDEAYFTNATTTLDLNNHIVNYTAATATYALTINKTGSKLIIDDSSTQKGGQFGHRQDASKVELLGIYVQNGELQLAGGTIIAKNTCIDGEKGAGAKAIIGGGANSIFNMTGGTLLAQSRLGARAYNSSGDGVFNATGGDIIATTEYTESSTTKWGANAYGVILWNYGTFNMSGTTKISVTSGSGAIGVYPYGGDEKGYPVANISGGSISCLTKTDGTARSVNVHGARATVNISGGDITANGPAGQYNIEDVSVHHDAVANITGGNFHSTTGANCVGVRVFGGTATISSNAFFDSQRGVVVGDWAEAATATATAYINGGTFVCPVFAFLSMSNTNKYDKTNDGTVTGTTYVNGGYFKTASGQNICSTSSETGRLILNGGYYNETSGTTQMSNITTYKGSTTQVNTLSPAITVDGRTYHYELKTKFNVTWKGGTSYNKEEELWSGTMPSNAECTSFVRNDSTFYFTGWSPVPSPVITDITYQAEGVYHVAKVKIGSGEWTIYDDFNEAWTAAMAATNATVNITLLNNVTLDDYIIYNPAIANARTTLDLNNFKLEENSKDYVIIVNKADAKLTITDTSKDKGGCVSKKRANTFNMYAVEVYHGEVIVAGGKVYCESTSDGASWQPAIAIHNGRYDDAKITVNGGTVEAKGLKQAHGINAYGNVNITGGHVLATITEGESAQALILSCGTATISGGTLEGKAVGAAKNVNAVYAFGWIGSTKESASNAIVNITGGTFLTTTEYSGAVTLQASGVTKLINGEHVTAHGIINVSGGEVTSKGSDTTASQIFAVQVHAKRVFDTEVLGEAHQIIAESKGEVNISGGTFLVDSRNNGEWVDNDDNIDLLRSWGTLNVTGGTFTIYQMIDPVGVSVYRGKTTISGNPVFNINCYYRGRGVIAGPWSHSTYCDKDASKNLAEVEVNGGTFNVTSETGTAYGAWAFGGLSTASTAGDAGYAMNAKMTINGGEFVCLSSAENINISPLRQENTRSGTYGDATAQLIVNGGKFKSLRGTTASNTATGYNIYTSSEVKLTSLTGGYYANDNQLAAHKADTCDLITLEETDPEYANGYRYKIEPHYVAKVSKAGASDRFFCVMKDAFDYAKTQDNSTITLLRTVDDYVGPTLTYNPSTAMSCTFDLNGFTFKGQSTGDYGTGADPDRLLIVSKTGCSFTIKDSPTDKTGKFSHEKSGAKFAAIVYYGTLVLESGTVHCKNTSGGAEALRSTDPDAIIRMTGGKAHAEASATAIGVNSYGPATISGGEILAEGEGTESVARGVNAQNANADVLIKGAVTINANSDNHAYGIYADGTSAKITVEAGTINSENANANGASITAYAISGGTIEINGGTFTATRTVSGTANVQTVRTANNATMIINGGTFNGSGYQAVNIRGGETTINGGTFNAAVGIRAMDWADPATITGKLTVKGGTFNTTAQTIYVSSMANDSRNAHSEVTIEGGKFNSTGSTIVQMNATPAGADPSTLTITGGYFNEKSGTTYRSQIANYIADTCKITDITSASVDPEYSNGYRYKIEPHYVAKVTATGVDRKFATFRGAFDYAKTLTNSQITLLDNINYEGLNFIYNPTTATTCTLDLNGYTFKGAISGHTGGEAYNNDRLLVINRAGATFTIKDSSVGKTGKFSHEKSGASFAAVVYHGTLVLKSGTVHCKNTSGNAQALRSDASDAYIQVTGGKAHAESSAYAYGVYANKASSATISGGLVLAEGSNAYGAHSVKTGSKVTVSGGKIKAVATGANAYGISVVDSSSVTVNGADSIYAKAGTRAYTVYADTATVTIEGTPAFYAESPNGARVLEGVGTGSITVNGGIFDAKVTTEGKTDCYALIPEGTSTITVNGGKFSANRTNIAHKGASATLTINGGYFNEYSTGTNHKTQVETYKGSGKAVMTLDSDDAEYIAGYRYLVTADPVAKVKAGSEVTYHTTIAEAIAAANELTNPTVTMLKDVTFSATGPNITTTMTLDLNGKTIKSTRTGHGSYVLKVNKAGITVTITDSGTGGKIDHTATITANTDGNSYAYGIHVANGTLNVVGGTIYANNKSTTVDDKYRAYGIYCPAAGAVTMSNGRVEAWRKDASQAFGIFAQGDLTMTGGTVYANADTKARGIYVHGASTSTAIAKLANVTVEAETSGDNCLAIYGYAYADITVNSGTYTANGTGSTVYAVYARSTATVSGSINGGKFSAPAKELFKGENATFTLSGGYYVHDTDLEANCATNYHVLPASLTEGGITYNHKVAEAYTLTWTTDGDALTGDYTSGLVEPGAAITAPATPTKTGYTFAGWSTTPAATMPASDVTYTATWTINSFDVTFNMQGHGTAIAKQTIDYNGLVTEPATPTEANYVFGGWYKEAGCTNAWNFASDHVTAATTLYAKWTEAVASVTVSGATTYYATIDDAWTAANRAAAASTIKLLKAATVTTQLIYDNENDQNCTLDLNGFTLTSNTNKRYPLYVNKTGVTFTITDGTVGKSGKLSITTTYSSGEISAVYLKAGTLLLEGGTIEVTAGENHTNGVYVNSGTTFTMYDGSIIHVTTTDNKKGRGVYTKGTTTINGGVINMETANNGTVVYYYAGTATINDGKFQITNDAGYGKYVVYPNSAGSNVKIKGGYYNAAGTYLTNYVSAPYHVFNVDPALDGTYTYEVAEGYDLTWTSDGDDLTGDYTSGTTKVGTTIVAPNTPTKTGYTFAGWSTTPAATMPAEDKTYTATWTANSNTAYTVKHYQENLDGTYPSTPTETDNLTGTTGASVKPAVKSYTGFTAPGTQTKTIAADGSMVIEYKYTRNSYTLTWNANGGELSGAYTSGSVKFGASITAPTVTRTGYTFAGWSTTPAATMPAEDKTYTAQWTVNSYTIRFLNHDGTVLQTGSVNYGETPAYAGDEPTKPTDATYSYTFSGWSPAISAVSGAQDYTAQFEQTANVASVTVGGATTYYTTLQDAFDYAADKTTPTIQVLSDIELAATKVTYTNKSTTTVTFDLNGHTISGEANGLLTLTSETSTGGMFVIKSGVEGGQIRNVLSSTGTRYCVILSKGKLTLQSGTIYNENTGTGASYAVNSSRAFTMKGGKLHAKAQAVAYGAYITGSTSTISGGEIKAETSGNTASAVYATGGTTTLKGTIECNISGASNVYGAEAGGANPSSTKGTLYNGKLIIEGGTFNVTAGASGTAYGVYSNGGVRKIDYSTSTTYAGNYADAGDAEVKGGVFTVKGKKTYGIGSKGTVTINTAKDADGNATYEAASATPKVKVTGGKFDLQGTSTKAAVVATSATITNTDVVIEGGYYNINTNLSGYVAPTKSCHYYCLSTTPADKASVGNDYNYKVAVAYTLTWNLDGGTVTTAGTGAAVDATGTPSIAWGVGDAIIAPTVTKTGYTFAAWTPAVADVMPSSSTTYTATWTMDVVGDRLDIVDWTATDLTINANGWAAAGWPYTINGTSYGKESRAADRTLTIPYSGEAGTDLRITVESGGSIIRQHYYRIPFIGTATGVTSADTIYVNSGTLAIDASSLSKVGGLYICPGASVNITKDMLSIGKLVLRTLPWQSGAISGSFTATETWYTRIAPNNRTITGPYAPITYAPSNYYQFGLPLGVSVKVKDIQVSNGEKITYGKAWLVKRYDEAMRASSGFGDNWVALDENESIQGGAGYEMSSNSPYYREYYFPVGEVSSSSLGTSTEVAYHLAAAGEKHAGWNVVTSPLMGVYDNTKANPESGMKVSWLMTDGSYDQGIPEYIYPAVPFSYQTEKAGSVSFSGTSLAVLAPRRRVAAEEEQERIQWIHLDVKDADGIGDHTSVLAHPTRYDETYQTGIDVAKQSFEASRALLYTVHAYGDMAFAGVADSLLERGIPVTVYSPAGQELTFSLRENDWLDRLAEVWLIDNETGARTDLLRDDYSFLSKAGTTAGRFVIMGRFYAPGVATGIMDAQGGDAQGAKAQKVLVDDKMYILINGRTYDATGKLVTNNK